MIPIGGRATLYGVLYQLLGSLHHVVRLRVRKQGEATVVGARLVIEPPRGGGDLLIVLPGRRSVEQWKGRTNERAWGLQEILNKVLPDLYLDPALNLPGDQTNYVFATEGRIGPKARAFFERLRGPVPEKNPLAGLSKEDRKLFHATARTIRKRKNARSEPLAYTHRKLRSLLSRFEIRENQKADRLAQEIDEMLRPLMDYVEDIPAKRDQLCTIILRRGTGEEIEDEFMPEDLLREAGLGGVSLEDEAELRRKAHEVLEREVTRRKYDWSKDVREAPVWPEDRYVLYLSGESGQGKTWQIAHLALDREKKGRLVVIVDSRGEAERDLQKASDLLWKEARGRDRPLSLDRLVERWHQVRRDARRPWLTICVENVLSLSEARMLAGDYDWERWGVELALTGSPQIGATLEEEHPNRVHHARLRDFTPAELREFLRRHGRSWDTVPANVRDTLKRPLLAGLYTSLGSDSDWRPTHEYELYERSWKKIERDLTQNPEDLHLLRRLALTLFDEGSSYPWTWNQLRDVGVDPETRERLERTGWWTRNDEGVEVWHDRMLSWALAEALAEQKTVDDIASRLNIDRRPESLRIRRILAYLPMDVLWLLSANSSKRKLVSDLLVRIEEVERPFGYHRLYRAGLLPTLGLRIFPGIVERLRRLPDRSPPLNPVVEALSKILDREPDGRAALPSLLTDSSKTVRKLAVRLLARHPHVEAIDSLWSLLREKSMEMEESSGRTGLPERQSAFAALRACLELDPGWLRDRIQESQPEGEPLWELTYLLANIKHPAARSIWLEVKGNLFEKIRSGHLHSLMVCIRTFRDREEVPRLEAWLPLEEKWTANNALEGIARIDPDRAVFLLRTMPLSILVASREGWLPDLLLNRPDETRLALRERMVDAGADFWRVANLYWWYEQRMDRETLMILLDRLGEEVTAGLQNSEDAWSRLRRALRLLSRIHRLDLLEVFQAQAGTDLDRSLGELGTRLINVSHRDPDELRMVLLKIGGEGIRRLIQAGLASSDPDRRDDAMAWALIFPDEIAAIDPPEEWAIAAVGENRALVEKVMDWEEIENDDLTMLWRLRRWKPPMSYTDLALALEALGSSDPQKRVRGLAAVSISGREDLLSQVPEWLERMPDWAPGDLEALDNRAAYLVHRLAEGNSEGVRRLAGSLNVWKFSWTAIQLLTEGESTELADRLESDLLERWMAHGRLSSSQVEMTLYLAQVRRLPDPLMQAVWESGKDSSRIQIMEHFFPAVSRIDSEEVRERIWKEAFEARHTGLRTSAIRALNSLEPDEALRAVRRGLEDPEATERVEFVDLLFKMSGSEAVPWLVDQAVREKKTEVLWSIARTLRRAGPGVEREFRARLDSPDFQLRKAAAHLAGWQESGFLETDLQRMAEEDPDDDVQWECLQALSRQHRERCIVELMDAFRSAQGIARWSYLESILELGDPRLLVTEDDPLWLGRILTPKLGALEVHANRRLERRFDEVKRSAEQRDRSHED